MRPIHLVTLASLLILIGCSSPQPVTLKADLNATSPEGWTGRRYFRNNAPSSEEWDSLGQDGRMDLWRTYNEMGQLILEEQDRNRDGRIDQVLHVQDGAPRLLEQDEDYNGKMETRTLFRAGTPIRRGRDTNGDGRPDTWSAITQPNRTPQTAPAVESAAVPQQPSPAPSPETSATPPSVERRSTPDTTRRRLFPWPRSQRDERPTPPPAPRSQPDLPRRARTMAQPGDAIETDLPPPLETESYETRSLGIVPMETTTTPTPTDSTIPVEPIEPMEPIEPGEASDSMEPIEPTEPLLPEPTEASPQSPPSPEPDVSTSVPAPTPLETRDPAPMRLDDIPDAPLPPEEPLVPMPTPDDSATSREPTKAEPTEAAPPPLPAPVPRRRPARYRHPSEGLLD